MKDRNNGSFVEWIIDIFNEKSLYNSSIENESTHRNSTLLFAITVQLTHPNKSLHTVNAQLRFEEAFSAYYAKQLRKQCAGRKAIRSRHRWDQPLVFVAFDMEGSRFGYKSSYLQCPHGHGLILFSERQFRNFLRNSVVERNADGSMRLLKPAKGISVIEFQPLETSYDAQSFADYAVKHATKLTGTQDNYAPYTWYPCPSKYHPFWKEYANERRDQTEIERLWSDRTEDCLLDTGRTGREPAERSGHHPT